MNDEERLNIISEGMNERGGECWREGKREGDGKEESWGPTKEW